MLFANRYFLVYIRKPTARFLERETRSISLSNSCITLRQTEVKFINHVNFKTIGFSCQGCLFWLRPITIYVCLSRSQQCLYTFLRQIDREFLAYATIGGMSMVIYGLKDYHSALTMYRQILIYTASNLRDNEL